MENYNFKKEIHELFNDYNDIIKTNNLKLVTLREDYFLINNFNNYIYIDKLIKLFEKVVYINGISRYKEIKNINLNILLSIIIELEINLITMINYELFSWLKYFNDKNMKISNIVLYN